MAVNVRLEEDVFGKPIVLMSDPSVRKIEYEISRLNGGSALWAITPRTGPVPRELQGFFTNRIQAEDAVKNFLRNKRASKAKSIS
jgi:hypothetical protein